ncbi:MAG: 50S ribosomal protein L19 [Mycoplasmataceae bacterium]|jgi:large subunit ribosomal protein L19|nr:50S ribosomal protein L19 [Mycoplasmataceae bacterium]
MTKLNKGAIIRRIERAQMREDLPEFRAGDTVSVHVKIVEGNKTRVQRFDGIVLKITGKKLSRTFTIRKESNGVGVEETFSYHSPLIVKIEVVKKGKVRRAYISYMRKRSGKSARIKVVK